MDKKKIAENIDKYIDFYAGSKIGGRGKRLYKDNKVSFDRYDTNKQFYYFKVKGTRLYTTKIKGMEKLAIETSCSCPYTWGSLCKHSVAALLYYKNHILENNDIYKNKITTVTSKPLNIEYRKEKEAIVYQNYDKIRVEDIIRMSATKHYNLAKGNKYKIYLSKIEDDIISFVLLEDVGYFYQPKEQLVTFEFKEGKVYVNTTKNEKVQQNFLRTPEIVVLKDIAVHQPDFFAVLFNKKEKVYKYFEKNLGLTPGTFQTFYRLMYQKGQGLVATSKEDAPLILSNNEDNRKKIKKFIDDISSYSSLYLQEQITETKKVKRIGFGIVVHNDYLEYTVISAKPNKAQTKLISKFEHFDPEFDDETLVTPQQEEIIKLIVKYNKIHDPKNKFILSKQIFSAISAEKFTFLEDAYTYGLSRGNLEILKLKPTPVKTIVKVVDKDSYIGVKVVLRIEDKIIDAYGKDKQVLQQIFMITHNKQSYHFDTLQDAVLFEALEREIWVKKEQKDILFHQVIAKLSAHHEVAFEKNTFDHKKIELDYQTEQIYLTEKDDYIIIKPQVVYDKNIKVLLQNSGNIIKQDENGKLLEYVRNFEMEQDFIDKIAELHPEFETQKEQKYFYLHYEDFIKDFWFYKFFDRLNEQEIEVYGLKNLTKFKYSPYKGKVSTSVNSGEDWFDVKLEVSFGNETVSLADIRKAITNRQKFVQLKDGSVGILPEKWVEKLEKYFRQGEVKGNTISVSKLRFAIIDELFENIDSEQIINELQEKRRRLKEFKEIKKTKIPKEIKANLRPYQKEGVNWLNFLDEMKWGGILADDMGLGKTLQILTFLRQVIKKDKTPNLIVVPTTLMFNWKAEIEKFAPHLKVHFHYGGERNRNTKAFKSNHLIITTYGIMMRDIKFLKDFKFNYVILDESQAIKNPASRRYKAVHLLQARNRIAMTGTPVENSTFDLYAQMNFVNPGFFGNITHFKKNYSNPIDKEGNSQRAEELQKIVSPFILRRTKEQVAKELPPKIEDIIYCEMEPAQRTIYDAYRNEYRNKLLKNIEKKGMAKSKFLVLEALTRLRQICDSPALIDGVAYDEKAIKIKEIVEHIKHKTARHKILIFSQFVTMLELIKEELTRLNIPFEYLDGKSSSKQRETSVENFQTNPDLRVFLISLKAGGTGLNLTAADYVYIIDPWWNPAVENQAIDRVYRIGQDKHVFAYRMICKNTVEEKILNLQAKKRKIATDIIQTDENIMKNLSLNELKNLFE